MFKDHKALAYAIFRLALGVNIFGHGFFRILSGVATFANGTIASMDKGPLPHSLSLAFLYATPYIELTLGLLIILGLFTRYTLVAGALFIIALTFGTTTIQNWAGAGTQLNYSLVFFILLWLADSNTISADALLRRRS